MNNSKVNCPICGGNVSLPSNVEVTQIFNCAECNNRIVVESISKNQVVLAQAPEIEEDWGE